MPRVRRPSRATGDAVAFRHELARLAVESVVAPHRRRALHAAILRALEPTQRPLAARPPRRGSGRRRRRPRATPPRRRGRPPRREPTGRRPPSSLARSSTPTGLPAGERAALLDSLRAKRRSSRAATRSRSMPASRLVALYRELGDRVAATARRSRACTIPYIRDSAGTPKPRRRAARRSSCSSRCRPARAGRPPTPTRPTRACSAATTPRASPGARRPSAAAVGARRPRDRSRSALNMVGTSYIMAGEIDDGLDDLLRSLEIARADDQRRLRSMLGARTCSAPGSREMYELEHAEHYLRECIAFAEARESGRLPVAVLARARPDLYRGRVGPTGGGSPARSSSGTTDPISRISASDRARPVRARRGDPGAFDVLDEALETRAAGRPPAAARPRPRGARRGRLARRRRATARSPRRGPSTRSRSRSGTSGSRRARLLAVEGGRARRGAGVDRGAVPAPARTATPRVRPRRGRAAALPVRGGARRSRTQATRRHSPSSAGSAPRPAAAARSPAPARVSAGPASATRANPAGLTRARAGGARARRRRAAEPRDRRAARALARAPSTTTSPRVAPEARRPDPRRQAVARAPRNIGRRAPPKWALPPMSRQSGGP